VGCAKAITTSSSAALVQLDVIGRGRAEVEAFFGSAFLSGFDLHIFPHRTDLDRFAHDRWGMASTECWMVAMGSGSGLVLLDPSVWSTEACEHDGNDAKHVHQIVTHELVHVFHGQHCPNHEFDGMDEVGWFIEGLAYFAAGQLDEEGVARAGKAAKRGLPHSLATAWSGESRYVLSASLVAYLDRTRGRATLLSLLTATNARELLERLGTTEDRLLAEWRADLGRG
jgi:hypothetical protein